MWPSNIEAQADTSAWPQVQIELIALDRQGNPIPGVTTDALHIDEDGLPQQIEDVKPANEAQSVCILIDTSGSMYDRLENLRHTAERLLRMLPEADEVCVATVAGETILIQDITHDRASAQRALLNINAEGPTALREALEALSRYLKGSAKNRDCAIVLLSDGSDNASRISEQEMKDQIERRGGLEVNIIDVPADSGRNDSSPAKADKNAASRLAGAFGGLAYSPHKIADMDQAVDHLVSAMQSRYVLTYRTADAGRNGKQRRIAVQFDRAHQKAKSVIRAQEGYSAPAE